MGVEDILTKTHYPNFWFNTKFNLNSAVRHADVSSLRACKWCDMSKQCAGHSSTTAGEPISRFEVTCGQTEFHYRAYWLVLTAAELNDGSLKAPVRMNPSTSRSPYNKGCDNRRHSNHPCLFHISLFRNTVTESHFVEPDFTVL